jgi:hypothetical protein
MKTQYLTDDELGQLLSRTFSLPHDLDVPPGFLCGVWQRIDAWELQRARKETSRSILGKLLSHPMRNGEPVAVLVGTLLFSVVFIVLFMFGAYLTATQSPLLMKAVQVILGPNLGELRSAIVLAGLVSVGALVVSSLALSERLFGAPARTAT